MSWTSLLMFSSEFSLERDLCNTFVLSFHTWNEKQNLIICWQVKEEIKGMNTCYIKETPYNKNKAEAYYLRVFASEYNYNRYFFKQSSTHVNRVQYTVVKAVLL